MNQYTYKYISIGINSVYSSASNNQKHFVWSHYQLDFPMKTLVIYDTNAPATTSGIEQTTYVACCIGKDALFSDIEDANNTVAAMVANECNWIKQQTVVKECIDCVKKCYPVNVYKGERLPDDGEGDKTKQQNGRHQDSNDDWKKNSVVVDVEPTPFEDIIGPHRFFCLDALGLTDEMEDDLANFNDSHQRVHA